MAAQPISTAHIILLVPIYWLTFCTKFPSLVFLNPSRIFFGWTAGFHLINFSICIYLLAYSLQQTPKSCTSIRGINPSRIFFGWTTCFHSTYHYSIRTYSLVDFLHETPKSCTSIRSCKPSKPSSTYKSSKSYIFNRSCNPFKPSSTYKIPKSYTPTRACNFSKTLIHRQESQVLHVHQGL